VEGETGETIQTATKQVGVSDSQIDGYFVLLRL